MSAVEAFKVKGLTGKKRLLMGSGWSRRCRFLESKTKFQRRTIKSKTKLRLYKSCKNY